MNHFYVLRNNREAGPFTRAELKAYGLAETDLLWVDGESREWKHPSEIEGLEAAAPAEAKTELQIPKKPAPVASTATALPEKPVAAGDISKEKEAVSSHYTPQSANFFHRNEKHRAVPYTIGARFFGAAVLLTGLALCGFVVVSMLKQFDTKPAAASDAVELSVETLPASNVAHTAEAVQTESRPLPAPVAEKTDTTVHKTNPEKKPVRTTTNPPKAKKADKDPSTAQPASAADDHETALPEPAEEKPEPARPVSRVPSLQLSANDYKVGLFGGISNLEITIANPSGQSVARAIVEIEYLKPNGKVVRTQTATAENLPAGGSKTLQIPSSGRGVKVRCRVVSEE